MLSLWANWLVTKFGLTSLKRYLWPVLYYGMCINNLANEIDTIQ